MATGLIGTLAALVLGLLIASAKSSFDQKTNQVRQMTASIIVLDDLLAQYGPQAAPARTRLRQIIEPVADRIWNEQKAPPGRPVHFEQSAQSSAFEKELENLAPDNDAQRALQSRAIQAFTQGAQTRLLLCPGRRFDPGAVFDHSGFLARRDFRQLHPFCKSQSGRDGLAIRLRLVVCRRDLSGSGAG